MAKKVKKADRPMYKIEKEKLIWDQTNDGWTRAEIVNMYDDKGITDSIVRHTLTKLKKYKTKKDLDEYFKMAFAMVEIMEKNMIDPDMYLGRLMSALYVREINTEAKLKKMKDADFDELLEGKQLRCAGWKTHSTLIEYRANLRGKKLANG